MLPEASRRGPGPKARQKPGDDRGGAPVLSPPESNVERGLKRSRRMQGLCFFGGGEGGERINSAVLQQTAGVHGRWQG